ncbi:CinA family protein [Stenoxybacter acetivorans]|uniref:CinA family protein n=1 Tax=Stenoxybacter acetivorans TaxID=422441 RepID=UPI000562C3ED|nr:nicotinamide-nucleotide amidohydrolase family protein [Stenoxybacter acetivorans]
MNETLNAVTAWLQAHQCTVTCAESCTGGLLAAELTCLPGSSAWFDMGFVTYSNEAKQTLLNVREATLRQHGAVSAACVREMAQGALLAARADYALSVSGIAGPTGGTTEKPVGTVWFGLSSAEGVWAEQQHFIGSRDEIRAQAVCFALALLARRLSL